MINHSLAKMLISTRVTELIANELKLPINKARDLFYCSKACELLNDEETGLYGESPYRTFELFLKNYNKNN